MRTKLFTIAMLGLLLFASALFVACQKQNDLKSESLDCKAYVDLNFSNYDSLKNDPITVDTIFVDGDCLKLRVQYGGCTTDHPINLAYMHPWCGTPPLPPPTFEIKHDSQDELCKMLVRNNLSFDLTPSQVNDVNKIVFTVYWNIGNEQISSKDLIYNY